MLKKIEDEVKKTHDPDPGYSPRRRARVKTLFASIDMDGNVATWAERWGLDKDKLKQLHHAGVISSRELAVHNVGLNGYAERGAPIGPAPVGLVYRRGP